MFSTQKRLEILREHFRTHNKIRELRQHLEKVHTVQWSCDGRKLATGSKDKSVRIQKFFKFQSHRLIVYSQVAVFSLDRDRITKEKTFYGHNGTVDQLTWHSTVPDLVATASEDKTIRIWDTKIYKHVSTISTRGENINITWSNDGHTIAVGNKEDLITFIDTRTNKILVEKKFDFEVNEIMWNNAGNQMYMTSGQGSVYVLDYHSLNVKHVLKAHPATCICIDFDKTGKYFAVGSADALTSLWDVDELCCLRVMSRLDWPVRTVSFSHDSKLLASASEDHFVDIACVESGEQVCDVKLDSASFSIAFHPKQYLLAYACDDKREDSRDAGNFKVFGFFE